MTERVFIALGSNLPSPAGDPAETLRAALASIGLLTGFSLVSASSLRTTRPVSPIPQPEFVNAVCELAPSPARSANRDAPRALLADLLAIERRFGRDRAREQRWGPRTLDLDLLLWGERVLSLSASDHAADALPALTLPHPRMRERDFVLAPLAEIAPELRLPPDGERVTHLLARCAQPAEVRT